MTFDSLSRSATHFLILGNSHDLVKGLPGVIHANGVLLLVADMIVCSDKNPDRVRAAIASWNGSRSVCQHDSEMSL